MSSSVNPWLTPVAETESRQPEECARLPWAPGALVDPVAGLPVAEVGGRGAGLWVVGAHGGAGASTLAALLGAGDAGQAWPVADAGTQVVVVARTHAHGINCAQEAAMQWAAGQAPGVELVGVVWVPDAPGHLPRELARRLSLVSGAFPASARVPWVGAWRLEPLGATSPVPKHVWRALSALPALTDRRRS